MDSEKNKKLYVLGISCAIIFIILYLITNISAITGCISGILSVFAPIIVGAAIAYLLNPLLKLFEFKILKKIKKKSLRRGLSLLLTYVSVILFIIAFFWLIIPSVIDSALELMDKFDTYVDQTLDLVNKIVSFFSSRSETPIDEETLMEIVRDFLFSSGDFMATVAEYVKNFGLGLFVGVKNAFIGFFISIYILISKEHLHAQVRRLCAAFMKDKARVRMLKYVRVANRTFGSYFIGVLVDSLLIGIMTLIALLIFKIPYAVLVATVVAITNIIPVFGPFIGAIPSAFIIFISSPQKALLFLIIILCLQQLDGNVIAPKILGNSTGISSLGVLVAITIMGAYFGFVGMVVGVPVFATIIIIVNELIETKLRKKGMPDTIEDYYPAYSLVDPNEHHEKIGERIFKALFGGIAKIFKRSKKKQAEKVNEKDAEKDTKSKENTEKEGEPKDESREK